MVIAAIIGAGTAVYSVQEQKAAQEQAQQQQAKMQREAQAAAKEAKQLLKQSDLKEIKPAKVQLGESDEDKKKRAKGKEQFKFDTGRSAENVGIAAPKKTGLQL